jgi:hypothetical protein
LAFKPLSISREQSREIGHATGQILKQPPIILIDALPPDAVRKQPKKI